MQDLRDGSRKGSFGFIRILPFDRSRTRLSEKMIYKANFSGNRGAVLTKFERDDG